MKTNARLTSIISRYTGNTIVAHEFNYNVTNQLIYDNNGVQVYSNPAFHYNTPGPVSLKLVWNNITIAYSGSLQPLTRFPALPVTGLIFDHLGHQQATSERPF